MSGLDVEVRCKAYAGRVVLQDVRFSLPAGQLASLVGPLGCGKTTLLKIAAGLDAEADADVAVGGAPPHRATPPGIVFQDARLMPWLSVRDNLTLVAADADAAEQRAADLLRTVGLADHALAWPHELSGGMQRRAAFARALMNAPTLLLLDEPFQSLDVASADRMRDILDDYWRRHGATVLMVTHDQAEAARLSQRALVISDHARTIVADLMPAPPTLPQDVAAG